MSYGYGVSVSALQMARAYTLFTNDGVLLPVTFNKREGEVIGKQILSAATARVMAGMLETVTQQGGTATKGQVPGFRVAGKTGTARKLVNGQYSEALYLSSFVGYGPASSPRFIVAITIDEPAAGKIYGGDVSAPVFSNVMSQALRMAGVVPDAPSVAEAPRAPAIKSASVLPTPQAVRLPAALPATLSATPPAAQIALAAKDRG
jgi:cell division protein FtsI (penicillin-binding protein 3)